MGYAHKLFITSNKPISNNASNTKSESSEDNKVYDSVDEEAQFPGGADALNDWLLENVKDTKTWLFGKVGIAFDVMKTGKIKNVQIVKSLIPVVDRALKAAFISGNMPNWIPAKKDGKEVNSRHTLMLNKPKQKK